MKTYGLNVPFDRRITVVGGVYTPISPYNKYLGILAHLLTKVMEPKYHAFWR